MAEGPVTYTDKGGGGPLPPHGEDFFDRIIGVHWPKKLLIAGVVKQQGLSAIYDRTAEGNMSNLRATALDSGQSFSDVHMGASGMGYTVLTGGLVCFGKPTNGDPCFMACPDFNPLDWGRTVSVMRGTLSNVLGNEEDHSIEIKWEDVASGPVVALTFANGLFFVTMRAADGGPTSIITFDGSASSSSEAFPWDTDREQLGGAVAGLNNLYVSCGSLGFDFEQDVYYGVVENLAWATSSTGTDWSYGFNASNVANPGMASNRFHPGSVTCTVAGGNGVFVAATTDKKVIISNSELPYITHTGAASVSTSGTDWSTSILPGMIPAGGNSFSFSTCVAFIQTGVDKTTGQATGYFLCGGNGFNEGAYSGGIWLSPDGSGWGQVVSNNDQVNVALSAVAKDLAETKIVRI